MSDWRDIKAEHPECFKSEADMQKIQRDYEKAVNAQAMAASPIGMLQLNPVAAVIFGSVLIGMAILLFIGLEEVRTSNAKYYAARDKAFLDCRLAGGTYEYFGTQGYVCIPSRNQDGGSVR